MLEDLILSRTHFLAGLLAVGMAVGCKAQPAPPAPDQSLNHHIEIMVRSQYNIPPDYSVTLGARKPSQIPGYETLPITVSHNGHSQEIEFLISDDGKTLARFDKFDLLNDPSLKIDVTGRPIRGNPTAKVTVINFDDLQCPYCAQMHRTIFPATLERYKDKVRFIYKDNPLVEIHPWAMHAAVDAECLAAQSGDAYWSFVDYVHSHGAEVSGEDRDQTKSFNVLNRIARQIATLNKLNDTQLDLCLAKQDESPVRASMKEADSLKVEGAPAIFVNGERISGAMPQNQLWIVIDRALHAEGEEPPPAPDQSAK